MTFHHFEAKISSQQALRNTTELFLTGCDFDQDDWWKFFEDYQKNNCEASVTRDIFPSLECTSFFQDSLGKLNNCIVILIVRLVIYLILFLHKILIFQHNC